MSIIDVDVHNELPSADVLAPHLDPYFRERLVFGERPGGGSLPVGTRPWLHPEGYLRRDAVPDNGVPGSDYPLLREQLLDRFDIAYGILTGDTIIEVSTIADPRYASALAAARNDWELEEWLGRDPRLKGSIVVAPQDPAGAAAEIRRHGGRDEFVQVLVSTGARRPYGDTFYDPIWEAAAEVGLPVSVHIGATGGLNAVPSAVGPATYFWEYHALLAETAMGHIASLLAHGTFERWPNLRFAFIEAGLAWLPGILWRLDIDYKALRKETPWLKRLPSEYARDHIRLSTQPLEIPRGSAAFWEALEELGAKDMLLFASDYPHWDFDDPTTVAIPGAWREQVFSENARRFYGLPERAAVPAGAIGGAGA